MELLKNYQDALELTYPSLKDFSDIDWNQVTKEHLASFETRPTIDEFIIQFPEFLQSKSIDGDAPAYLYELAFFELLQVHLTKQELTPPEVKGISLNPTLSFLDLEYDILPMLASKNEIIPRNHILCVFKSLAHEINHLEISSDYLGVLQKIESDEEVSSNEEPILQSLVDMGLVFRI